ncbi:MAG: SAM-dependent methyltransferase [Candidatus Thiodiazotropha sp. (ex Monitilora ramsayi)]|nr:SAM-dependent methyltransferase [Candidatus Thiodiazotropha sp. (ex Monitilora ramsayi)]
MSAKPPLFSIALLSAAALAYEILLMRLFSIIQWHHFAYLVIALALLGYGISGTLLSIAQHRLADRYANLYLISVVLFALSSLLAFLLAQTIPFNMEELLWNERQIVNLIWLFLLLALPFVFAAAAICLTFMAFTEQTISRIYMVDLLGAGLGSLGVIMLMYLLMPETILPIIGLTALTAAAVAVWELKIVYRKMAYFALTITAIALLAAIPHIQLTYSPFKGLSQALQVKGARIIEQRSSPLGHLTVVVSDEVPLRHAPGLSLTAETLPPAQLALFVDADNVSAITQASESIDTLAYLDQTTSAIAYHLQQPETMLVIGSGTGSDLLQAQYHQAASIDALELNAQVTNLIIRDYARFAGKAYLNPHTHLHITEAREYLTATDQKYDLIQIALTDAAGASSSGLYALNESYLYTREAIQLFISHLNPGGYLSVTRWIKMPPRDTLKLFATTVEVMQTAELPEVEKRLALIRSWQTSTLLVKNGLFDTSELEAIEKFCDRRFFDLAYTHNLTAEKSNRYNFLKSPYFYETTSAMVAGDLESVYRRYKFDIRPATDDRPYFHHFFKWESFFEAFAMRGQGGMPLIEWGYVVLIITLLVTGALSAALILLPLLLIKRYVTAQSTTRIQQWQVLLYFFGVGLAFLFIEIAFIQKFLRFLHHPTYAIAISLTAFLVFAGLGSLSSQRLAGILGYRRAARLAIVSIGILSIGYLLSLDSLFIWLGYLPMSMKMLISMLLIAPLAFTMGMPFPLALSVLKRDGESLLPWAWGINGYASVISAILATLIAIHLGFQAVILMAVGTYLLLLFVFPDKKPG